MPTYTNIAKPIDASYTRISFEGNYIWDDPNISYDDSNVYWDGINTLAYINISRPVGSVYTSVVKPTT